MSDGTQLLQSASDGDPQAAAELLPLVYDELRRLASHRLAGERNNRFEAERKALALMDHPNRRHCTKPVSPTDALRGIARSLGFSQRHQAVV